MEKANSQKTKKAHVSLSLALLLRVILLGLGRLVRYAMCRAAHHSIIHLSFVYSVMWGKEKCACVCVSSSPSWRLPLPPFQPHSIHHTRTALHTTARLPEPSQSQEEELKLTSSTRTREIRRRWGLSFPHSSAHRLVVLRSPRRVVYYR